MSSREVRALIIQPDGESVATSVKAELDALQAAIGGGYIECVTLPDCHLYCDEEGKLKGLPMNSYATALARRLGWQPGDVLCGPVIFLGNTLNGEEGDLPQAIIDGWFS